MDFTLSLSGSSEEDRRDAYARLVRELGASTAPELTFVHRARDPAPDRVGVLAASFDPPTRSHLRMAEIAHERHGLREVVLELSIANVDKEVTSAPLSERLMLLLTLVPGRPWLSIGLGTHARFIEKVAAIRPHVTPAEVVFIVGADTLVRVFDAKYYEDRDAELDALFASCTFLCANRSSSGAEVLSDLLDLPANRRFASRVGWLELDAYHASLSASSVRAAVRDGAGDLADVPESVACYIRSTGLYR